MVALGSQHSLLGIVSLDKLHLLCVSTGMLSAVVIAMRGRRERFY